MIDFIQGYIVLAFQQKLIYADMTKILEKYKNMEFSSTHFKVKLTKNEVQTLDLDPSYKIICINQIGLR